jgi:alpha-tubulin suppressor-like RCC1 family protein
VVAWGLGPLELDHGQTRVPPTLSAVSAIAAGGAHALALVAGGRVIGWGANDFGQAASPSDLDHVVAIAAGATTSLALRDDGTIRRWGNSLAGDVVLPAGIRAIGASAASSGGHVEVLGTDGAVWGWGDNAYGQLGNGTRLASTEPVRASGLPPNDTVTNPVPFVVYTPLR